MGLGLGPGQVQARRCHAAVRAWLGLGIGLEGRSVELEGLGLGLTLETNGMLERRTDEGDARGASHAEDAEYDGGFRCILAPGWPLLQRPVPEWLEP